MRKDVPERVAMDILSILPLVFRGARRKLIKRTLSDAEIDITPLHFEIMRLLYVEGVLHAVQIGESLLIAKAQMTPLLDKLENLNIIDRTLDTTDRRTHNITLTSRGRIILEEHNKKLMDIVQETMSHLTDEDLAGLSDSLGKLRDILSKLQ